MSVGAALRPPHELGLVLNRGQSSRFKVVELKTGSRAARVPLSSCALRQDGWNLHVSYRINRQLHYTPRKCNIFVCRSFVIPSSSDKLHLVKTATSTLTRSYSALRNSPLVIQLAPAVGIIVFAVWGLGPLMRLGRNLLFQRNDSNWKKSRTYHVLTSYLRPLLLWTGAILICKMLDPIILSSEASQAVKQRLLTFVKSLSTVLAFAYCLSNLIQQTQKFFVERNDSSDTQNMGFQFAGRTVYTAVWVAAISLFMELLGFSTQKWVTAGGLGTVLLTLAGREIFTNFLSSIMIHATRPFVLNEWIQTKIEGYEVSGTVEHVGWWSPTIIRGDDREAVHIPNHKFTVNVVRNLTQKTHWRIKTHLAISHLDVNKINNIVADMRKVLAKNPQVEHKRLHRRVFLENINPENQALLILVSCFVKTSHFEEYLCVKEAVLLDLLRVVSHHRARLATPIRTVQKSYGDPSLENIPFAETIFTHAEVSRDRPLLLVEPPTRINGNDKAKSRPTTRSNEEQSTKTSAVTEQNATAVPEGTQSTDQPQLKTKPGDAASNRTNVDSSAASATDPSKPQQEAGPTTKAGSEKHPSTKITSEKPPPSESNSEDDVPLKGQSKRESEKVTNVSPPIARSTLEDNIVLGVALEGSKRTLPIEEGMGPASTPAEGKELATARNGSAPSSVKDKKGQVTGMPGSPANEPRDER